MTYLKNGTEYLDDQEMRIYRAVARLNERGRTTNNSQVAEYSGYSRTTVGHVAEHLRARGFLTDISKPGTAAYHWRTGAKTPETEKRS